MADSENTPAPPSGGVFVAHSEIMDSDGVRRALWRMAHEILEQNKGLTDVVLVGLETGGVHLAKKLAINLLEIEGQEIPVGTLDVAFYRDDIDMRLFLRRTQLTCHLT